MDRNTRHLGHRCTATEDSTDCDRKNPCREAWAKTTVSYEAAKTTAIWGIPDQTMVSEWKKQAMEGLTAVFSGRSEAELTAKSTEAEVEKLHAKIGQLLVERDFLAKASGR